MGRRRCDRCWTEVFVGPDPANIFMRSKRLQKYLVAPTKHPKAIGILVRSIEDDIFSEYQRQTLPMEVLECLSANDTLLAAAGFHRIFEQYNHWPFNGYFDEWM